MADSVPVSSVPQTVTDHVVEPQPAELTTTVRFSDTCKDSSDIQPPSSRRDSGIEQSRLQHRTSGTSLPGMDTDRSKQLQVVPERWQTLSNKSKSSRSRSKSSGSVLEELVIATVFGGDQSSKLRRSSDRRAWSIATDAGLESDA